MNHEALLRSIEDRLNTILLTCEVDFKAEQKIETILEDIFNALPGDRTAEIHNPE